MPKGILDTEWDLVHELACDIANAALAEDDELHLSKVETLLVFLDELLLQYGEHPSLLATKADYIDDPLEKVKLYKRALKVALELEFHNEIAMIEESLKELDA